ncbi:MAG: energy-coupling factor transporter transmembrane protein EcfT [Candidatus Tectomicrobia bacterium]|uniref:Energy-coupling factor transporter transmembrane protein EcfT n=1 Tax=Tectimicrobiota bacterium TaxID=2528274 RepID=A0A932CQL5_UNCTE|nr:energy-coupling factor transporter transmembrane protein EcfT [Candidatus Tectomicrobia bacterium]
MSIYLYLDQDSPIHRLHPLTKVSSLMLLFVAPMLVIHPVVLSPFLLFLLGVGGVSGSLRNLKRVWPFMATLFSFTFLIWSFFYGGQKEVFRLASLRVTQESLLFGLGMALRLNLLFFIGLIFLSTTRIEELTVGLQRLGLPYIVSFTLGLAFRLVPVFMDAALTIVQAQRSRGLDFGRGGLLQRLRHYLTVMIPVFMTALRKADGMAVALEARGFRAGVERTACFRYSFGGLDGLALVAVGAFDLLYLMLRAWGMGMIA